MLYDVLFAFSIENNTVYGFGDNSDGQLGQPEDILNSDIPIEVTKFDDTIIQISAGSYHTAVLIGFTFFINK